MAKITIPGQNVPIQLDGGAINPTWYEVLKRLEPITGSLAVGSVPPASIIGNPSGAPGAAVPITLGTGLSFSGTTLVGTSIDGLNGAFTFGYGLARTAQALRASLTSAFAALGADVLLNNIGLYFDGPFIPQATMAVGTWFVTATVTVADGTAATFLAKLWDGTTVMASAVQTIPATGTVAISLSGIIINPVGNVRVSVRDSVAASGAIRFNTSGNSRDSHITAMRIA